MKNIAIATLSALLLCGAATAANAVQIVVPGQADPWLAGMPVGTPASIDDVAGPQSPVLLSTTPVAGSYFSFVNPTGGVSNNDDCCRPIDGADFFEHRTGAENGIADAIIPISALVGVFLDASQPDSTVAPATLDFTSIGLDFTSLHPELKQVFFIGDGMNSFAQLQQFYVPTGATRLYLGVMDGFEWNNNPGAITLDAVQAVPEPSEIALMLLGLGSLGVVAARRKARRDVVQG